MENPPTSPAPALPRPWWRGIRDRILSGLLVVSPILITIWLLYWLYSGLDYYVIDPLARLILWKVRGGNADTTIPVWFESYAAPLLAISIALSLLYCCGFLAQSRLRRNLDWLLLRVPVLSIVYDAVRSVFQGLDNPKAKQGSQRLVLISFPHPGMRLPAFVTSTIRDIKTQKTLLCVYVPTTPVPTSGFFLMVPEEEVTELNWNTEQTLQAIISGGLTAPPEVSYFGIPDSLKPAAIGTQPGTSATH